MGGEAEAPHPPRGWDVPQKLLNGLKRLRLSFSRWKMAPGWEGQKARLVEALVVTRVRAGAVEVGT